MVAKEFVVLCISVLFVQTISTQCIYGSNINLANNIAAQAEGARLESAGSGYGINAFGLTPASLAASNGGYFTVSSISPIAPTGVKIFSDNTIEGPMDISGRLPVLATVGLEGQMITNGAAGTTYGCGNGQVGISGDSLAAAGLDAVARPGLVNSGRLMGAGLANSGFAGARTVGAEIAAVNKFVKPCGTTY